MYNKTKWERYLGQLWENERAQENMERFKNVTLQNRKFDPCVSLLDLLILSFVAQSSRQ